ncbi:hypothetical protein JN531_012045 [Flagellatimonas centrodinii]|uniref:hypothetical protein n=1 Tax=Flagellatimonas centrodinii TaxID=2806210 RepID=UPI001FEF749A|nr:hypothetical protein [Flagellatimonas centrodinii]ULQ45831.1 hypothetical protein JN531_012045 [Flagellatimonas centrodinii]
MAEQFAQRFSRAGDVVDFGELVDHPFPYLPCARQHLCWLLVLCCVEFCLGCAGG